MPISDEDWSYLERAVALGRQGWGRVHPNPLVGCVLVREGRVIAEAHHAEFGGPHAEVIALDQAGTRARDSTAYVSLEPCRHEGKTPACTAALIRSGVGRVVYGASDPTEPAGGGGEELRRAGIEVEGPVLSSERAHRENAAFHHAAERGTPFIALKLATSLDGSIAASVGVRTRLTGSEAQYESHRLRAGYEGILVGSGTALVDDPSLTIREPVPHRHHPTRIVLDSAARLTTEAALFRDAPATPLVLFVDENAPESALERLEGAGARVHPVPRARNGAGVDLATVLRICWDTGLRSILCEGGGRLAGSLVEQDLVGRLYLFIAPRILGPDGVSAFDFPSTPEDRTWVPTADPLALGQDVLLTFDRVRDRMEGDL